MAVGILRRAGVGSGVGASTLAKEPLRCKPWGFFSLLSNSTIIAIRNRAHARNVSDANAEDSNMRNANRNRGAYYRNGSTWGLIVGALGPARGNVGLLFCCRAERHAPGAG